MRPLFLILIGSTFALTSRADTVRLMSDGELGLAQIHRYLSQATESIDISTFIWEPCSDVGRLLLDDLRAGVRRGVRVRVLLDAWAQTPAMRRNLTAHFSSLGIELRYFNVRGDFDPIYNRRMHAKIIAVDGQRYYLGGRNIADDYFDLGTNNWMDRDVAVEGPSARDAARQFEMLWTDPMTAKIALGPDASFVRWAPGCFRRSPRGAQIERALDRRTDQLFAAAQTHVCADVRVHTDEPGFADVPGQIYLPTAPLTPSMYARKHTTRAVVDFVAAAQRDLVIENYTYVPEGLLDDALSYQRRRGLPIRVYTNVQMDTGPIHYLKEQSVLKDRVGSQEIVELSNRGAMRFPWALTPRTPDVRWSLHTKAMVSGDDSLVGSFNIDPRSYGANLESTVVVNACPSLARDLRQSMRRLDAFHARDASCAKCQEKETTTLTDQIKATVGRRLYFKRPR